MQWRMHKTQCYFSTLFLCGGEVCPPPPQSHRHIYTIPYEHYQMLYESFYSAEYSTNCVHP